MKKYLFILLLLISFFISAAPIQNQHSSLLALYNSAQGGAACTVDNDSAIVDDTAADSGNNNLAVAGDPVAAMQFTLGSTTTVTEYHINTIGVNTSGDATFCLQADSSDSMSGSCISGTSKTINIPTGGNYIATLDTPKTDIAPGIYWLVMSVSGSTDLDIRYAAKGGGRFYGAAAAGYIDDYTLSMGVWGCQ